MKTPFPKERGRRSAFTLIEMLAATTVLSMSLLMMGQMASLSGRALRQGTGQADNFAKSRAMLDLIAGDLERAVYRPDLPMFQSGGSLLPATGNFSGGSYVAAFFTRRAGTVDEASVRNVSRVSYDIDSSNAGPDKIALCRSDVAVTWDASQNATLPFQGRLEAVPANATAQDLAPGVVAFQFMFRHADGTVATSYTGYDAGNPVVAVGMALAVVGSTALQEMSASQLKTVQTTLAGAAPDTDVKESWDLDILTSRFFSGYPKDLATSLRTFERWVGCPAF